MNKIEINGASGVFLLNSLGVVVFLAGVEYIADQVLEGGLLHKFVLLQLHRFCIKIQ